MMVGWYLMTRLMVPLLLLLGLYALVRGIMDLRAGRKVWGIIGIVLALAVVGTMLLPIETHAVGIDLGTTP